MNISNTIKPAFLNTVPVMLGYIPIGIAFGFLLVKSGFPWYLSPLMSILIYSGAGQFIAIEFFVKNLPVFDVIIVSLLLNLRHSFFGLSLFDTFSNTGTIKPYLIFALTDETYALITTTRAPDEKLKGRYYFFLALFNHLYWITGSVIGALLGKMISFDLDGLQFALTALFVVLTIEQYNKIKRLRPFVIAFISGSFCLVFVKDTYMLLVSIIISITVLLLSRNRPDNG